MNHEQLDSIRPLKVHQRTKRQSSVDTDIRVKFGPSDRSPKTKGLIKQAFTDKYGASISFFLPQILEIEEDRLTAGALGAKYLDSRTSTYLEKYLEDPIENVLAKATQTCVARETLAEIGNFVAFKPGAARWLIISLCFILHSNQKSWAIFTARIELLNAFRKLGLPIQILAQADKMRLEENERKSWGCYYENGAWVAAANVTHSFTILKERRPNDIVLESLWTSVSNCLERAA